jgi:hypothetical protein
VPEKGLEIQFDGGDRCFEFVCEVVDKVVLQSVKFNNFLIVNENDENPQQNEAHQQAENQHDQPGLGLEDLIPVQVEILDEGVQALADRDIPINIKEQGQSQCKGGANEDKNRMKKPLRAIHAKLTPGRADGTGRGEAPINRSCKSFVKKSQHLLLLPDFT